MNGEILYGEFYNKNEGLFCLNEEDSNKKILILII